MRASGYAAPVVIRFIAEIVPGRRAPYTAWNFLEVPASMAAALGHGPVRGTLAKARFRGTAGRSEGVLRIPVTRELLERAGVSRGDRVPVALERNPAPRPVHVPPGLEALLDREPALARAFAALPPSHRRAWAGYVAEAKRPETRERRVARARAGIREREFPR